MSKSATARWYIGAWIVTLICAVAFFLTAHVHSGGAPSATSPVAAIAWMGAGLCSVVMLIMWIGALVRVAQLRRWGWFVALLVLQILWLGIVGMVAYAMSGPEDAGSVTRPSFT